MTEAMHKAHWSKIEDDFLAEHFVAGVTIHDIAQRLRRSCGAVEHRIRSRRLRKPRTPLTALPAEMAAHLERRCATEDLTALSAEFGVSRRMLYCWAHWRGIRQPRKTRAPAVVTQVSRSMRIRTYSETGRLLGMSRNTVAGIYRDIRAGRYPELRP